MAEGEAADDLARGRKLAQADNLDDAADAFGAALEKSSGNHGEDSPALAEYYYAYGDVLLRLVEKNGDIFGGGAQQEEEDPQADQENTEPGSGAAASNGAPEPDADDMELAWQMLELARVAYSRTPVSASQQEHLADVLSRLGDLSQTNDQFDKALSDYKEALGLRVEQLGLEGGNTPSTQRAIAAEHSNVARALQYQDNPLIKEALHHSEEALKVIDALIASSETEKLEAIRTDMTEKVEELRDMVRQAPVPGEAAAAATGTAPAAKQQTASATAGFGSSAGTTTIGFGSSAGTATVGFGSSAGTTTVGFGGSTGTTTIGFGSSTGGGTAGNACGVGGAAGGTASGSFSMVSTASAGFTGGPTLLAVKKRKKAPAATAGDCPAVAKPRVEPFVPTAPLGVAHRNGGGGGGAE